MKLQQLLVAALLIVASPSVMHAQQPLNLCCHPEDIRNWTPGSNPDDVFNVSKVPLARRFKESQPMKANSTQNYGGEICNSTILYPTCSLCPSQGEINNFLGYQPTYWQYMDKLVYWAGAASEGIINIPPAPSTDAAHAQGVKSLGNIFFPPSAFGGQQAWVREMLTQVNGKYIFAIKLYELCKYFNFDGWFINEETGGSSDAEWAGFFRDFYEAAAQDNNTTVELQWYNALRTPNETILRTNLNTSQFLEYGAVGDYRHYASRLNCTQEQTFSKIYAGVQCVNSGHTGWMYYLNSAMPSSGEHVGSLDLFCPEVGIWERPAKQAFKSPSRNHGTEAHAIGKTVFDNEEDMWVNLNSDPSSTTSPYSWKGVSSRVLERSAITSMPFLSDMGVGNGKHRFVEGAIAGTADWYHSGMQSILPTWRWWIENRGNLQVAIDWDNAYNVGSSFKISGTLSSGDHLMRLYKTQISVTAGGIYRVVYKSSSTFELEAKLSTTSSVDPNITLTPATTTTKNGWTVADFDLSSLNGQTIYMLALNLKAGSEITDFAMNLGQIAVLPAGYNPTAVAINDLQSTSTLGNTKGDIRLTWNYTWNSDFDHFDIYVQSETGDRKLIGQTRGQGFYIPEFARNATDSYVNVDVVPVMKTGKQKSPQTLRLNYPEPTAPTVTFSISPKSYCVVGETVTLTANVEGTVTSYQWNLPAGLELASGSSLTEKSIRVIARTEGKKTVSVDATNSVGTSNTSAEVLDVFATALEMNEVTNVLLNKKVVSYSGSTNSTETPKNIIDGVTRPYSVTAKWCNISADNEVVLDCQGAYRIYGFTIYDGNSGPETGVDQIDRYTIEVSLDKETWTKVVDREGVDAINIKEDYIAPVKARYIRLRPHVNGTLRIWEFQAFGKADNNMTVEVLPTLKMNAEETQNITVKYNLNGDQRSSQFTCTATASNSNVTIGEITEDQETGTFTIPVTSAKIIGTSSIRIRVDNGGAYKESMVEVSINSTTQPNVLSGLNALVRKYEADYSFSAPKTEYTVTGLTDGDRFNNALEETIQVASRYKDDVWAIFTAPTDKGWNLSKIKLVISDFNQGLNENEDEMSYVNKDIKIAVGNDLNNLTTVHTFSNLQDVRELEYIFPEFRKAKYIAIICNLYPLFYASLAEVEAYEQYAEAVPFVSPLAVTGWTHDVLVEALSASTHANGTLDSQGWAFFTTNVQTNGAISDDSRLVRSRNGIEFQLGDYAQNNAAVLRPYQRCTLTVAEPVSCEELYFLTASSNGAATLSTTIIYDDNTTSPSQNIRPLDWYRSSSDGTDAVYGLGRIKVGATTEFANSHIDDRLNFRIFEFTLPADKTKKVKSISFYGNNYSSWGTVLAISRKGTGVSTGITEVNKSENVKEVVGIYNLNGMKLNAPVKGVNIIKYSDGSTKKILVQ